MRRLAASASGALVAAISWAMIGAATPAPTSAQLSAPCELTCGLVLGATGFTVATGALVARGRSAGGVVSVAQAADAWFGGLLFYVGAGIALNGDGELQERAVYAGGIGALGGSLLGVALESVVGRSSSARKVAAALMGAAAGAVAGGVYGALSHEGDAPGEPFRMELGFTF